MRFSVWDSLDSMPARRLSRAAVAPTSITAAEEKQSAVSRLIQVYSLRGHQIADLDPLKLQDRPVPGVLKLDYLGLTEADTADCFSSAAVMLVVAIVWWQCCRGRSPV